MQKLTDKHRYAAVDGALRFFRLRAKSHPDTAALAPKVAKLRGELRELREAQLEAFDERVAQSAVVGYCDARLDRAVLVGLKRDLAVLAAGHPKGAALEKKLFQGIAPSAGMKPVAGDDQEGFVRAIVKRLETDADFATIGGHAAKIGAAQQDLDAAIEGRTQARVKERTAQADLDDALDRARRFYNQLHPQVALLFPDDPALVETFFRTLRASAGAAAEPEGGGDEPVDDDVPA